MSDVLNPVDIEQAIRGLANRISNGVRIVSDLYEKYLAADREYDKTFSKAFLAADGAENKRKHEAVLASMDARERRDDAEAAFKYADRTARALENELRAMQSVGASVRAMYQSGGTS